MKTLAIITTAILISFCVTANNENKVKSEINKVTIFKQGAQVFRTSGFDIKKGMYEYVFSGISPNIDQSSIRAGGKGDFIILDVRYSVKQPTPIPPDNKKLPPLIVNKIEVYKDSLADINFDLDDIAFIANLAGGLVCEKPGVVPIVKEQLLNELKKR